LKGERTDWGEVDLARFITQNQRKDKGTDKIVAKHFEKGGGGVSEPARETIRRSGKIKIHS